MSEAESSPLPKEGLWNDVPEVVMDKIFSYLTLRDRVRAGLVCKGWYKGFESPIHWKYVDIWLTAENPDKENDKAKEMDKEEELDMWEIEDDGYEKVVQVKIPEPVETSRLSFSNENALQFAQKFGNYVKSLRLMCDPVSKATSSAFLGKVSEFLHSLVESSCELTEFVVFFSNNVDDWDLVSRKELIDVFCEFFENQRRIETLIFCNYITGEEVRLLEAVAKGSRTTIKKFHCMFYSDDGEESKYQETYRQVLSDLSFLQYLSISYNSLNNETITILNNCKRLKAIYLYDLGSNRDIPWRPVYPAYDIDWKKPLKIHAQVKDNIVGEYWLKCPKFEEFLPIKASVYANKLVIFEESHQIVDFAKDLREKFPKNLACISITDRESLFGNKPLEEEITILLRTCTELKELKLELNDPHELLEDICKLQFQNKIDLQSLWFLCFEVLPIQDKVKTICKQYSRFISYRNLALDLEVQHLPFKITEIALQSLAEQEQAAAEHVEEQEIPEELDDQDTTEQQQSDDQNTWEQQQSDDQGTGEQHQSDDQGTGEQHQSDDQDSGEWQQSDDQESAEEHQEADQDTAEQHQEADQDTAEQYQEADQDKRVFNVLQK